MMTEHSLWRVARAFQRALEASDPSAVAELIDDDIDWRLYGPIDMFPFLGARSGKAEVMEVVRALADRLELRRVQREATLFGDDEAASILRCSFTLRSSQKPISVRLAQFARFRNGRLASLRGVIDTFDLVEQALGRPIALPKIA